MILPVGYSVKSEQIPTGHYVYIHRKVTDNEIFYVGKGKGRRAWSAANRNSGWRDVAMEHVRLVQIVKSDLPEACALTLERIMIFNSRGSGLVNQRSGGVGNSGWTHSEDARKRMSAFQRCKKPHPNSLLAIQIYNADKVLTADHKFKLRLAKLGKPKKTPHSEETKRKISAAHVGLRPSSDTLKKMSESKIGKCSGRNNPTYDHTIRTFVHADHGQFIGTRGDFILKYGLRDGDVSVLISGKQKSAKGWRLP